MGLAGGFNSLMVVGMSLLLMLIVWAFRLLYSCLMVAARRVHVPNDGVP